MTSVDWRALLCFAATASNQIKSAVSMRFTRLPSAVLLGRQDSLGSRPLCSSGVRIHTLPSGSTVLSGLLLPRARSDDVKASALKSDPRSATCAILAVWRELACVLVGVGAVNYRRLSHRCVHWSRPALRCSPRNGAPFGVECDLPFGVDVIVPLRRGCVAPLRRNTPFLFSMPTPECCMLELL
jgi:hypothetical protein